MAFSRINLNNKIPVCLGENKIEKIEVKVAEEISVKNYKILSKVILIICLCGIILTIINSFTGIINSSVKVSGTIISITLFLVAGIATMLLENERMKKRK